MPSLSINSLINNNYVHRPLIFHTILWTLAFSILIFIFSKGQIPIIIDAFYTILFLILIAVPVCINFYLLIPQLLKKEKYLYYALGFVLNGVVFGILIYFWFQNILDTLFPSYFFISYLSQSNLVVVIAIFLVSTTLLKLGEDWFYFNKTQNKILRLERSQFQTQLSALRSQLNPHFLFNSLNVIYALALDKNKDTTNAILELSDILRYVIYDSNTERVALKDEIRLLKNYIAFQNHRIAMINPTHLDISIEDENYKIYPMLLLPLIENSYKHGTLSGEHVDPIRVTLNQEGNNFMFTISNPILNSSNTITEKYSGVGLENLKQNLELVYPERHEFQIVEDKNTFKVKLMLNDKQV